MPETWKKLAFEDDVILKTLLDAQSVLISVGDNSPAALVLAEQEIVGRLSGADVDGIVIGIADNNMVQIDGTAANLEHAIFNAAGIEGLTDAELLAALSGDAGAAFDWAGQHLTKINSLFLTEKANADSDVEADGQLWVKTATPNELWFTTDAGDDIQLTSGTTLLPAAHAMLDGTVHSDSVAQAVTRGSLILANDTPAWDELVIATGFLNGDGTDVAWKTYADTLGLLSGAAAAAFDWNGQQLQNMLLHIVADDAARNALASAIAMVVWHSTDNCVYVCTEAEA